MHSVLKYNGDVALQGHVKCKCAECVPYRVGLAQNACGKQGSSPDVNVTGDQAGGFGVSILFITDTGLLPVPNAQPLPPGPIGLVPTGRATAL